MAKMAAKDFIPHCLYFGRSGMDSFPHGIGNCLALPDDDAYADGLDKMANTDHSIHLGWQARVEEFGRVGNSGNSRVDHALPGTFPGFETIPVQERDISGELADLVEGLISGDSGLDIAAALHGLNRCALRLSRILRGEQMMVSG